MKIISEPNKEICISNMKDGEIALITKAEYAGNIGRIVQRYGKHLISLGRESSDCHSCFFDPAIFVENSFKVRILKSGTIIEL